MGLGDLAGWLGPRGFREVTLSLCGECMVVPIKSALGMVRHLLPFATGGSLPLVPKLPDFGSVLSEVGSMITGLLGGGETDPEERETEDQAPAGPVDAREPAPFRDALPPDFPRAERMGYRSEAGAPVPEADAKPDSAEETPAEEPADPTLEETLNKLQDVRRRAGLEVAPVPSDEIAVETAPLPVPSELALEELEWMHPLPPPALPPNPLGVVKEVAVTAPLPDRAADRVSPVGRAFVDTRAGGDAPSAGHAPTAPSSRPADPSELVERIVKAARLTQSRGMARIKISLSPAHLGDLKVDLSVRQHVLHGTLQADNAAARDLLLAHLNTLRETLEQQGIQVGDFQVSVDQSFQQASRDPNPPAAPPAPASHGSDEITERSESPASPWLQMFDVVV